MPSATPTARLLAVQMQQIGPSYCRMCGECDGQCRQGLPVADVLRFLTYADGYGQFGLGAGAIPGTRRRARRRQVRRLSGLHGPVPVRGAR